MSRVLDLEKDIIKPDKEAEIRLKNSDIDLEFKKEELEGNRQDREQRKGFANKLFILLASFIAVTLLIIFLVGFGCMELNDAVLITMLSTMSANVIGIFIYVVMYLFKSNVCPNCGLKITQSQTIKS